MGHPWHFQGPTGLEATGGPGGPAQPFLPGLSGVFAKHHSNMIFQYPELQSTFPAPPMPALRQTPNLRHYLCRSRMYNVNTRRFRNTGWRRCNKVRCKNCDFTFDATTTVTAPATGYQHSITTPVNCDTENGIYGIFCDKQNCSESYIGKCSRRIGIRLNEHRSAVKRKQLSQEVANHFNLPGHGLHHLKAVVLEKVRNRDPFVLKAREHLYIGRKKFDSFARGMNKEP